MKDVCFYVKNPVNTGEPVLTGFFNGPGGN